MINCRPLRPNIISLFFSLIVVPTYDFSLNLISFYLSHFDCVLYAQIKIDTFVFLLSAFFVCRIYLDKEIVVDFREAVTFLSTQLIKLKLAGLF